MPWRRSARPGEGAVQSNVTTARLPWWEPVSIFLATFAVLALFAPRIMTYLNPVTGDEPFYLMTTISIWKDGDLNECNNYRQVDEASFHPAFYDPWKGYPRGWKGWGSTPFPLTPHPAKLVPSSRMCADIYDWDSVPIPAYATGDELYSKHGLGLSLLILPAFVAGGRELVVYFLVALGALLAANVYLLGRESATRVWPALLTWVALAFTVPQLPYSYLIFPELPAALFVIYAYRRIRLWDNNLLQVAAIGTSIAFLPWLHYRFVPVSAALFIYFMYASVKRGTPRRLLSYSLVIGQCVLSAGLLMYFFYHRYQQVYPNVSDHAGSSDVAGTLRGAAGLLIDVQWGLFIAAPIYVLAIVGVILMAVHKTHRRDLLWLALVFVPYFGVIANYAQFWGEWCPPARYLASILPLLAMPFAITLDRIRNIGYYAMYVLLLAVSLATVAGYLYQPQWMYHHPTAASLNHIITKGLPMLLRWLPAEIQGSIDPQRINASLPSFVLPYFYYLQAPKFGDAAAAAAWSKSVLPAVIVGVIVALSLVLAWWSQRKRGAARQPAGEGVAPVAIQPSTLVQSAPAHSDNLAVPANADRRDEAQPTYRG
ncbi:MAG: hypothetical protein M3390_01210 [Chloroflexota bacterium]|nr:hypothetical protein [Chloroflexota bacterium]